MLLVRFGKQRYYCDIENWIDISHERKSILDGIGTIATSDKHYEAVRVHWGPPDSMIGGTLESERGHVLVTNQLLTLGQDSKHKDRQGKDDLSLLKALLWQLVPQLTLKSPKSHK